MAANMAPCEDREPSTDKIRKVAPQETSTVSEGRHRQSEPTMTKIFDEMVDDHIRWECGEDLKRNLG
jgi:hypothetical protein